MPSHALRPLVERLLVPDPEQRVATAEAALWRESEAGGDVAVAQVAYRITVRGATQGSPRRPLPEQRLREGSRVFNILAVTERDPQGHYLVCFAREEEPA